VGGPGGGDPLALKSLIKSPWILHFDTGSCNGCDIEIFATLTPLYDVERFGILNAGNPKHADVLVLTGPVTQKTRSRLLNLYEMMPEPKLVMAVGDCACSGAPFVNAYNTMGGVDTVIPVDIYVPGCACRPEAVIDGVVKALEKLGKLAAGEPAPPAHKREVSDIPLEVYDPEAAAAKAKAATAAAKSAATKGAKDAPKEEV